MKLHFLLPIYFVAAICTSQAQERIQKDLQVTKQILQALYEDKSSGEFLSLGNDDVSASYSDNYGVIYSVEHGSNIILLGNARRGNYKSTTINFDNENNRGSEYILDISKSFLADYGFLLRDVKDDQKIQIRFKDRHHYPIWHDDDDDDRVRIDAVEVSMKDVKALESGSISRETFMERVKEVSRSTEHHTSFDIFASTLKESFVSKRSRSYYMSSKPRSEYIQGVGLTYDIKVYSSNQYNNKYSMPTIDRKGITDSERNKIVEELYPKFIEDFKKTVLDYGVILKDLEPKESIDFNIDLTRCTCDIPREIQIHLNKDIIDQYRENTMTEAQAMEAIKVNITQN